MANNEIQDFEKLYKSLLWQNGKFEYAVIRLTDEVVAIGDKLERKNKTHKRSLALNRGYEKETKELKNENEELKREIKVQKFKLWDAQGGFAREKRLCAKFLADMETMNEIVNDAHISEALWKKEKIDFEKKIKEGLISEKKSAKDISQLEEELSIEKVEYAHACQAWLNEETTSYKLNLELKAQLQNRIDDNNRVVELITRNEDLEAKLKMASKVVQWREVKDEPHECSICMDECKNEIQLECGHVFHELCISQWLGEKTSCPNCREQLDLNK